MKAPVDANVRPRDEAPDGAEERAFVVRAQAGDVAAFESLYRSHVGRTFALCMRMTADAHEAEEMVQEAFVRAWEKLPSFGCRSAFGTWLHRLAANVVLSHWRTKKRRPVVAMDAATLEAETAFQRPRSGESKTRERVDLERAIRALPRGARTVLVLHDIEGFLHREVAELTGLAVGTTKAQLHRARRLLREALEA